MVEAPFFDAFVLDQRGVGALAYAPGGLAASRGNACGARSPSRRSEVLAKSEL